jgi:hypothetical protein
VGEANAFVWLDTTDMPARSMLYCDAGFSLRRFLAPQLIAKMTKAA